MIVEITKHSSLLLTEPTKWKSVTKIHKYIYRVCNVKSLSAHTANKPRNIPLKPSAELT